MSSDGHSTGEKFRPRLSEVPSLKHWPQKGEESCRGGTGTWVYSPCLALKLRLIRWVYLGEVGLVSCPTEISRTASLVSDQGNWHFLSNAVVDSASIVGGTGLIPGQGAKVLNVHRVAKK